MRSGQGSRHRGMGTLHQWRNNTVRYVFGKIVSVAGKMIEESK